jgi:hypothetical protein
MRGNRRSASSLESESCAAVPPHLTFDPKLKSFITAMALLVLCPPSCRERHSDPVAVQPHNALDSAETIRATLKRIFPGKPIPIYEVSDRILLAVVQDFDADRFLLVRAHGWIGSMVITRDDAKLEPPFEKLTIEQYGSIVDATGTHEDLSRTYSDDLGIWIPLKRSESLDLVADLEGPEAAVVKLAYKPDQGWSGSIKLQP